MVSFPRVRGKAGMGVRVDEMPEDHVADAFDVAQDFIIPEPDNMESPGTQTGIPVRIRCGRLMLASVDLDHQSPFKANEIHDVYPDRILTTEADARNLSSPQLPPQPGFSVGHRAAQSSGEVAFLSFAHHCTPELEAREHGWKICSAVSEKPAFPASFCKSGKPYPHPSLPPQAGEGAKCQPSRAGGGRS